MNRVYSVDVFSGSLADLAVVTIMYIPDQSTFLKYNFTSQKELHLVHV